MHYLAIKRKVHFPHLTTECWPIHPTFEAFSHVAHTAPFIVAFIINTTINTKIRQKLMHPAPGENGSCQNQQIKWRITWMLMANTVTFLLLPGTKSFSHITTCTFSEISRAHGGLRRYFNLHSFCFVDGQLCCQPHFVLCG